jgi:hypothetical protein
MEAIYMNNKAFPFQLKDIGGNGVIAGYASVFNVLDEHNDIIAPGAFKKSLHRTAHRNSVKLLWQHNVTEPIGTFTNITEDNHGLYIEAKLLLEVQRAREAYALLKSKVISGLSIGYSPVDFHYNQQKARVLTQIDLWEVSLVTFPANNSAQITQVKSNSSEAELLFSLEQAYHIINI